MIIKINKELLLRTVTLNDARDIFAFTSSKEATKYVSFNPHKNIQETESIIKKYWLSSKDPLSSLVIEYKGSVIGLCNIVWKKELYKIGYLIDPTYKKKVIIEKCIKALIDKFFIIHPDLNIYIWSDPENMETVKLIKHLKFLSSSQKAQCSSGIYKDKLAKNLVEEKPMYYHSKETWNNSIV